MDFKPLISVNQMKNEFFKKNVKYTIHMIVTINKDKYQEVLMLLPKKLEQFMKFELIIFQLFLLYVQ